MNLLFFSPGKSRDLGPEAITAATEGTSETQVGLALGTARIGLLRRGMCPRPENGPSFQARDLGRNLVCKEQGQEGARAPVGH